MEQLQRIEAIQEEKKARKFRRIAIHTLATVVCFTAVLGILYGIKPLLLPFILATFLAYLFKPLTKLFRGASFVKYVRVALVFSTVGAGVYWTARMVKQSLPSEKGKLELKVRMQNRLNERYKSWMGLTPENPKGNFIYKNLGDELDPLRMRIVDFVRLSDEEKKLFLKYHDGFNGEEPISEKYYSYYLQNLKTSKVDIEKLKAQAHESAELSSTEVHDSKNKNGVLAALMKTATNWIIFPIVFMFILMDRGQIIHFFIRLVPNRYFELTYTVVEHVDEALGKYIRGTIVECFLVGLTLAIGFYVCGIEFKVAFMIGALGGLTNAIPFVGTFIACLVGAAYSLIAEDIQPLLPFINESNLMIAVIAVVMIAHLLDNAIFQPLVVGSAVNLHPLAVIMGVFGGSLMFGFAGLLLAIPTIVITKVVTETFFSGLKDYKII